MDKIGVETKGEWDQSGDISWMAKLKTSKISEVYIMHKRRIKKDPKDEIIKVLKRKYNIMVIYFYKASFSLTIVDS